MKNFVQEFKSFIIKGNAIELAVGIVIGIAFNAVVNSLVTDIIMGVVATIFGKTDFSAFAYGAIKWGSFLNAVINLLIIGFSVFVVIKLVNKLTGRQLTSTQPTPK